MSLFQKLNLKDQRTVYLLGAPAGFKIDRDMLPATAQVKTTLGRDKHVQFVLAFVSRQKEVDALAKTLPPRLDPDAVVWFAYPKQTSKKYTCEFTRDTGWQEMGKSGFEPVRQVAIDEDWSALRFRNPDYIKKMTRTFAMTAKGKQKVAAARTKST
jgi:hypothetical protein